MNDKTTRLNKLFTEWENSKGDYKGKFKRDGINNEDKFESGITKVLFITKEPNDPKQKDGDYRDWWKEKIKYTFSHRIAEWSYGILNDFPAYDTFRKEHSKLLGAMHSVAFMNLKKTGGKGNSKEGKILEHLTLKGQLDFIYREIEIIRPDIIITGLTWKSVRKKLFPNIIWQNSGYSIAIGKYNGARVIDFYHPSSRTPGAASYSLLENVYNSEELRTL